MRKFGHRPGLMKDCPACRAKLKGRSAQPVGKSRHHRETVLRHLMTLAPDDQQWVVDHWTPNEIERLRDALELIRANSYREDGRDDWFRKISSEALFQPFGPEPADA
jgi:hypothetical protein